MNKYEQVMREFGAVAKELAKARKDHEQAEEVCKKCGDTVQELDYRLSALGRCMRDMAIASIDE